MIIGGDDHHLEPLLLLLLMMMLVAVMMIWVLISDMQDQYHAKGSHRCILFGHSDLAHFRNTTIRLSLHR